MLTSLQEKKIDLSQISDQVVIGMVIREDGELDGLYLIKGHLKELNSAIMDLISEMPGQWIPANLNGKPVNYYMELPFNFQQIEGGFESVELTGGFLVWD